MKNNIHHRQIRSFVRREGRITPGQKKAINEFLPVYGLSFEDGVVDFGECFVNDGEVVLEIGFGMGHSLVEMVEASPHINFIGIEVHRPGIGTLLNEIHKKGLKNIRVFDHDAVEVLQNCIADDSLDKVQIFFPDPWPKKRHHKRRLIQTDFIKLIEKKLKYNGILHLATDWENYAEHMLEILNKEKGFKNLAGENKFPLNKNLRPQTKFEKRGQKLGHNTWDLIFTKES
jgi:tRNA (guanine-N7-)-methyltransferase